MGADDISENLRSLTTTYRMDLLSARSILLDSTFKGKS